MDKLARVQDLLMRYNQEHLLDFYNELNVEEQNQLLDEILDFDLELVKKLHKEVVSDYKRESIITPPNTTDFSKVDESEKRRLFDIGTSALKNGEIAVVLMAGGQGTRLGHDGPKGTYDIGLPSKKSLFQLHAERILKLSKDLDAYIPWYIMTSKSNNDETVKFFENNHYFGLNKENIVFFSQDFLPITDYEGKIILEEKSKIYKGANGNGGLILALEASGALSKMTFDGIKWLFLYGVDNAMAKVADPVYIGYTIESGLDCSSKSIKKAYPEEKVGVFCYKDGKPGIVEYSELSEELRYKLDDEGELVFSDANIIAHMISLGAVKEAVKRNLPYHKAEKKYLGVDESGFKKEMNGIKYELFIFDLFESLGDMAIMRLDREDEFAPVKNKSGNDSPETARQMLYNQYKTWLIEKGISREILKDKLVEISPLTSYDGEGLDKTDILKQIDDKIIIL